MYATPLFDNDHQIIGDIEIDQDITEMKKTDKSVKQNLNQWDSMFDQSLFGIVYFSRDNTILKINERLAKYLKKTSETLKGVSIDKLFDSTSTLNIQNRIDQAKCEEVMAFQLSGQLKNAEKKLACISCTISVD